jgi:hypothetical protein
MAPLASGVPMGASHGIGYVLGTMFDIPHDERELGHLPEDTRHKIVCENAAKLYRFVN